MALALWRLTMLLCDMDDANSLEGWAFFLILAPDQRGKLWLPCSESYITHGLEAVNKLSLIDTISRCRATPIEIRSIADLRECLSLRFLDGSHGCLMFHHCRAPKALSMRMNYMLTHMLPLRSEVRPFCC